MCNGLNTTLKVKPLSGCSVAARLSTAEACDHGAGWALPCPASPERTTLTVPAKKRSTLEVQFLQNAHRFPTMSSRKILSQTIRSRGLTLWPRSQVAGRITHRREGPDPRWGCPVVSCESFGKYSINLSTSPQHLTHCIVTVRHLC